MQPRGLLVGLLAVGLLVGLLVVGLLVGLLVVGLLAVQCLHWLLAGPLAGRTPRRRSRERRSTQITAPTPADFSDCKT